MTRFPYGILFGLPELLRCRQSPFGEPIAYDGSAKFPALFVKYRQVISRVLFARSLSFSADFPLKTRCSAMRAKTIPRQYDSLTTLFLSKIIEIKFRRLSKYGVFSIYFKNSLEFNCVLWYNQNRRNRGRRILFAAVREGVPKRMPSVCGWEGVSAK